jgi:HAD superfamily hydrolase (TIGR01490 family)
MRYCENDLQVIAAFDFDLTITTKDTFVPFLYRAFGRHRVRDVFLSLTLQGAMVVVGLSDRDTFKERLIRSLFMGESVGRLRDVGRTYVSEILNWVRPSAIERIEWHKKRGDRLVMVSASLDLYLEPVARALGFDDLLCTRPSVNGNNFDGFLTGRNCRGNEKMRQLRELISDLSKHEFYAYGDSAGDRQMLEAADHSYYRVFENGSFV